MQFSDYIQIYITELDNIYDLVGNCFGLLRENMKDLTAFNLCIMMSIFRILQVF